MAVADYDKLGLLTDVAANFETVREAYRQIGNGNREGFFAVFADDVIAYDAEGLPYGGAYPGKDGLRELTGKMFNAWEKATWEIAELTGGGDLVVVHLVMTFTPRGGAPFDHPICEVWRFRDGRVVELRPFYYDTKLIADMLSSATSG